MMIKALTVAMLVAYSVEALSLKEQIQESLENEVAAVADASDADSLEVEGTSNCQNKCTQLFGKLNYYTAMQQQANGGNNEYRSCMIGCNKCSTQIAQNQDDHTCFLYCKNYDYSSPTDGVNNCGSLPCPIKKGIIEPDKACIFGCVVNLCQDVCTGEPFWGAGGCQLKTNQGVQTYSEGSPSSFNQQCCDYGQNLCTYPGYPSKATRNNKNWKTIYTKSQKVCAGESGLTKSSTDTQICSVWNAAKASSQC